MFRVATYNVLATAYIQPKFYPRCDARHLDRDWRVPALVRHVAALDADLIGLQEVERDVFGALEAALAPLGFTGDYAAKGGDRPDGCATFYRNAAFTRRRVERVHYRDGSGHVALLTLLDHAGRAVGLANTHLKWAPPGATYPLDQMRALIATLQSSDWPDAAWIVCGDFNVTPESATLAALDAAGFRASHAGLARAFTCNPNGVAKTIDFLCHDTALRSTPLPLPPIGDATPLPSAAEPSDHVAVLAAFDFAG